MTEQDLKKQRAYFEALLKEFGVNILDFKKAVEKIFYTHACLSSEQQVAVENYERVQVALGIKTYDYSHALAYFKQENIGI